MRISKASLEKKLEKLSLKLSKQDQDISTNEKKLAKMKQDKQKLSNQKAVVTEMLSLADQLVD